MDQLQLAINSFPIVRWLESITRVYDSGGETVLIDCPVCRGRKKLGVHRRHRGAHCFKCDEGGEGGSKWNGKCGLVDLIQMLTGCNRRAAVDKIFELSGVADVGYTPKAVPTSKLPREAISLSTCHVTHPGVQMLASRGCSHLVQHSHLCVSGRYSHRVLMPIQWFGELLGYDAKAYLPSIKPKSLFAEWMDMAHALHASHAWDAKADFVVITESVLDAETLGVNAIGLNGSVLRDGQVTRLLDLRDRGITRLVWFLDFDAFRKQVNAILRRTGMLFENSVVPLFTDTDPNAIGHAACWELVAQSIPIRDAFDLLSVENLRHAATRQ